MAIISKRAPHDPEVMQDPTQPQIIKEKANLRLHYELHKTENFDSNAVEHRIKSHVLES
jgi:hypothetical protein